MPEFIVCVSLFNLEAYRYNDIAGAYTEIVQPDFWSFPFRDCHNREDAEHVILPGGKTLLDYEQSGYGNLGYAAALREHPELTE